MLSPKAFALRYRGWVAVAAVLGVLILLYALLVENAVLVGLVVVAWLFGLFVAAYVAYLLYHFVHSVSRIADALEDDGPTSGPGDGVHAVPGGDGV